MEPGLSSRALRLRRLSGRLLLSELEIIRVTVPVFTYSRYGWVLVAGDGGEYVNTGTNNII